ncbi:hypothetical protein [Vreelandella olivaria]|uniref:hypothetical protein n=1 Tax=Vreelandella olivaria TaxID=390919 RepID=UPI00201F79B8|nr:hypothetical protein [Halomonas olivaria]
MVAPRSRRRSKGGSREWSLGEIELLERHFHALTIRELQAQYLPYRTIGAVRRMASKLGLKKYKTSRREYGQPKWTEEELRLVMRYFSSLKLSEIQRRFLPHRSVLAIRQAANKAGLRRFAVKPWTDEELTILRNEFPVGGAKWVNQRLPHRTVDAIKVRSRAEGLVYVPHGEGEWGDPWSAEELHLLETNRDLPAEALSKLFPHRNKRAVINKRYKLKWSPVKHWSEAELECLRQHLDTPLDELCQLFPNRPREGVRHKRDRLR